MKRLLVSFLVAGLAIQQVDSTVMEAVAVALSLFLFLTFIHHISKRIVLLECIGFIATLEILLVPAVTYWVFPASMPLESTTYFSYALPATGAFLAGLLGLNNRTEPSHQPYLQAAQAYLQNKHIAGIVLLIIGLAGFMVKILVPDSPSIIGTVPAYCLFISAFYAYFSRSRYRIAMLGAVVSALLIYTVRAGMFGDLFFWLMLMALFGAVDKSTPLTGRTKIVFVVSAFAFLLLIQSVKGEYRYNTWGYRRGERSGNASLLADLVNDRLANPEKLLNADHLFLSFVRFNQGIIIGSAMAKVPMHEDFAKGNVLLSFVYPLVPRFIWPDKPQTGGYENIRRFTSLPQSENTSINLSPLGEGYVNFGYGGILFAWLYGSILGSIFRCVLAVSVHRPSIILWLPMLYIGCLTMETDVLSTWGSLVNNTLFMSLLFWITKRLGIQL